ncbi:MAG: RNA polymerase sigma factor RpoD/SigA [Fibrobacteria bacterium]
MRHATDGNHATVFHGTNPVAAYLKEISGSCKLSPREEKVLAARIRGGDRTARNLLVEANLKFVVAVCRNYENQGLPLGDLINEGNLGLMRAAARFDETKDCRFISYAVWWIRQGIMSALATQTRDVTLSTSTTSVIHKINCATRALTQRLGRSPSLDELELETGFHAGRIEACMQLMGSSLSFDYAYDEEDGTLRNLLPDESEWRTELEVDRFQTKRALEKLLNGLEPRERHVIESFFGMGADAGVGLRGLSKRLGVSRERVRQLKIRALAKLKVLLNAAAKYPCAAPIGVC